MRYKNALVWLGSYLVEAVFLLIALVLLWLIGYWTWASPLAGAEAGLQGEFVYVAEQSDDLDRAIDAVVARFNPLLRPLARSRLTHVNQPYRHIIIKVTATEVGIAVDDRPPIRTPSDGSSIPWRREDGELFEVSTQYRQGALQQSFAAADGRRLNEYALSADGRLLILRVTVSSPRLEAPLRYKLVYRRVSL